MLDAEEKEQDRLNAIMADETSGNIRKVKAYWLPLLNRLNSKQVTDPKLVSVGCGFGGDIDELVNSGMDAYGVEALSRIRMWDLYTKKYRLIRFLQPFVKIYLRLLARPKFLRATFLSPQLISAIKK